MLGDRRRRLQLLEAYSRLVRLARAGPIVATGLGAEDEEDVAPRLRQLLSPAAAGRFPRLEDRDDLWRLLFVFTVRKVVGPAGQRGPQGAGRVRGGSVLLGRTLRRGAVVGLEPDARAAPAPVAEECRPCSDPAASDAPPPIAVKKMEGYTNQEIAASLAASSREKAQEHSRPPIDYRTHEGGA